MHLTQVGACRAEQSLSGREEFMFASVSHVFSHLVLVGLWEFVGGRERRAMRRALSTAGVEADQG